MKTLHTFGCSITQGFALPDVVQSLLDDNGVPLTPEYIEQHDIQINWEDIHLYQPSKYAWPQILCMIRQSAKRLAPDYSRSREAVNAF